MYSLNCTLLRVSGNLSFSYSDILGPSVDAIISLTSQDHPCMEMYMYVRICSTQSTDCVTLSENPQIVCQSAGCMHNLQIVYAIHAIWGSRIVHEFSSCIAHEFRLLAHAASHARAASSSDVSAIATMSTSVEEQHRKLFDEFLHAEVRMPQRGARQFLS